MAIAMTFAVAEVLRDIHRPVAEDRFVIAVVRSDGTWEPPVERSKLPPEERQILLQHSMLRFISSWEGYVFRANQSNYNFISAVTAGEPLRAHYQRRFAPGAPGNVDEKYGPDAQREVLVAELFPVPGSPFAFDAAMLVRLKRPSAITCQRWVARITYKEDTKHIIPLAVQQVYNPADIIFVSYDSHVDQTSPGEIPCAA
jgi:hypothetical protein